MTMDDSLILHLEDLAKLRLTGEERAKAKRNLNRWVDFLSTLGGADTDGIGAPWDDDGEVNRLRADVVVPSLDRELALKNAALKSDECFKVPKTVD